VQFLRGAADRVAWAAGYPGTTVIPALNYLLSLLALKLTGVRRVSHVDDLAADPGAALFAGLTALPKTTALTSYSYRLDHARQTALLTALGKAMIAANLITDTGGDRFIEADLRFHLAVAEATGNRLLLHSMQAVRDVVRRALMTVFLIPRSPEQALVEQVQQRTRRLTAEPDRRCYERAETHEQALRLHTLADRPNLHVKIPATEPGLGAIEDCIAAGRNINVTLIFSLERYREVVEAYIRGLERLVEAGKDPTKVASVASFFVSRVDTEADRRLDEIGGHDNLKGKLGIANARLAYAHWKEVFSGERWELLASKGATKQRCLWASTSVKNPDYRDVMYVEELIGPQTVNTMPQETIEAFQDHGEVKPNSIEHDLDGARQLLKDLANAGVDYDDVVEVLEQEGVQKFADSFEELLDGIRSKRGELAPA